MSWHEEFLSYNQKKNNIESLDHLFGLIEEVFEIEKDKIFNTKKTAKDLLREEFLNEEREMTLTLKAIPEIAVSELGWTDVSGKGESQIEGPERQRLSQFLQNIEGNDFVEKIDSLSRFYQDPDGAMAMMFPAGTPQSAAEQIKVALSYMVFYKTLTKVISNFNAASAGFNFEAFLAVLAGGFQVPANKGTIADFVSRTEGVDMPISLKLYGEGHLHVGGSFTDLVNDLTSPQYDVPQMRYIAVTKEFDEGKKAGLDINGRLKFMRFDFTLDNVMNILAISSKQSVENLKLASEFIRRVTSGEEDIDYRASLPGINLPSTEELEDEFILNMNEVLKDILSQDDINKLIELIGWSSNDAVFMRVPVVSYDEQGSKEVTPTVIRGQSIIPSSRTTKPEGKQIYNSIYQMILKDPPASLQLPEEGASRRAQAQYEKSIKNISNSFALANTMILKKYDVSALNKQRDKMLEDAFAGVTTEQSLQVYNSLDSEKKKIALKNSFGYLNRKQFNLVQSAVENLKSLVPPETPVVPEGQESVVFGTIEVGAANTQNMLNRMTSVLNEAIFDIFLSVKKIQDSTYSYVAGGLEEDQKANEAITASSNVISKTMELKSAKDS